MIPVLYHVPKCGGTYAIALQLLLLNVCLQRQRPRTRAEVFSLVRNLEIRHAGRTVARVLSVGGDPASGDPSDPTHGFRDLESPGDLGELFALIIEPAGFSMEKEILPLAGGVPLRRWMVLRDPLEAALSMHAYLTGPESSHEVTHGAITAPLEAWLASDAMPDCWILRELLDLPPSQPVGPAELAWASHWLEAVSCFDLSQIDRAIDAVFGECHGLHRADIAPRALATLGHLNRSGRSKPVPSPEAVAAFRKRTWADQAFYEMACGGG